MYMLCVFFGSRLYACVLHGAVENSEKNSKED